MNNNDDIDNMHHGVRRRNTIDNTDNNNNNNNITSPNMENEEMGDWNVTRQGEDHREDEIEMIRMDQPQQQSNISSSVGINSNNSNNNNNNDNAGWKQSQTVSNRKSTNLMNNNNMNNNVRGPVLGGSLTTTSDVINRSISNMSNLSNLSYISRSGYPTAQMMMNPMIGVGHRVMNASLTNISGIINQSQHVRINETPIIEDTNNVGGGVGVGGEMIMGDESGDAIYPVHPYNIDNNHPIPKELMGGGIIHDIATEDEDTDSDINRATVNSLSLLEDDHNGHTTSSADTSNVNSTTTTQVNDDISSDSDDDSMDDVEMEELNAEFIENEEREEKKRMLRLRKYMELYKQADFWLEHINIFFSVVSVGLFIAISYVVPDSPAWHRLNYFIFGISIYFVIDFGRSALFTKGKLRFLMKRNTIFDILSLLPIFVTLLPNSIVNVVPLAFLRVLRILKAPRLFKLHGANTVVQKIAQLILSIIIMILLFASMITSVEGIPFHNSLYFAVVTLSTVGYGDITPQSILGRMLTISMILMALLYLPLTTTELINKIAANKPWHRSFTSNKRFGVVAGELIERSFVTFATEYFFNTRKTKTVQLVTFNNNEPPEYFSTFNSGNRLKKINVFIKGSCGIQEDVERSNMKKASGIFIFSKQSMETSKADDSENILRVITIRSFVPSVPIYVQIMNPRAKQKMLDAGATKVISIQELKLSLLAQSCLSPGFSTMIMNLLRTDVSNYSDIDEYGSGNSFEIFTVKFSTAFLHLPFNVVAKVIYEKLGMIVFGVESVSHRKTRVRLNPVKEYVIKDSDSAIMLAKNRLASRRVKFATKEFLFGDKNRDESNHDFNLESKVVWSYDPDTKRYKCQLRFTEVKKDTSDGEGVGGASGNINFAPTTHMYNHNNGGNNTSSGTSFGEHKPKRKSLHKLIIEKKKELNHDFSVLGTIQNVTDTVRKMDNSRPPSLESIFHIMKEKGMTPIDETEDTITATTPNTSNGSSPSVTPKSHSLNSVQVIPNLNIDNNNNNNNDDCGIQKRIPTPPTSLSATSYHIPQCPPLPTHINGELTSSGKKPKRFWTSHYLEDYLVVSVEEMTSINNHIIIAGSSLCNLEYFIRPLREDYLRRYDPIVILTPKFHLDEWRKINRYPEVFVVEGSSTILNDLRRAGILKCSKLVVMSGDITPTTEGTEPFVTDKDILLTSIAARQIVRHNRFFPIFELIEPRNMRFLEFKGLRDGEPWNQLDPYYTAPLFARGSVFLSSVFDNLLSQCFYNRHILALIDILVGKSDNIVNRTKVFQVEMPERFVGHRFGFLFECLIDCNIICLGLYRQSDNQLNPTLGFVQTNPISSTILRPDDKLFILIRIK